MRGQKPPRSYYCQSQGWQKKQFAQGGQGVQGHWWQGAQDPQGVQGAHGAQGVQGHWWQGAQGGQTLQGADTETKRASMERFQPATRLRLEWVESRTSFSNQPEKTQPG